MQRATVTSLGRASVPVGHTSSHIVTACHTPAICLSVAFYFLFKDFRGTEPTEFATIGGTVVLMFEMTLGEYKVSSRQM